MFFTDTTTKPRIIITVGESFFSEEFLMSCYSNVTDTQDLYIKFKRERQPSYRLSTSPYIRALRRRGTVTLFSCVSNHVWNNDCSHVP